MTEFFGTRFYFTGAFVLGYVVVFVPLVLGCSWIIHRFLLRRLGKASLRRSTLTLLLAVALSWPFWDVVSHGLEAKKICAEQAGLRIYKTVEADGFLGGGGIEYWSKHGFRYVEVGGANKKKLRVCMKDGKPVYEEIPEFTSRYQEQSNADRRRINNYFERSTARVIDRATDEVLGELVTVSIYPIRFDLYFLRLLGFGSTLWHCGNEAPPGEGSYSQGGKKYLYGLSDVVKATLIPKRNTEGQGQ